MKGFLFVICLLCSLTSSAQTTEGTEFGIDGSFSASNLGGGFGLGVKYGWKFKEYFIAGPSLRYQRSWAQVGIGTASPTQSSFNVFGGGGFIHARFYNAFFVGTEIEVLRTPFVGNFLVTGQNQWAPNAMIGGGYSMEFNEKWRLNAGVFYDVINHESSPLRQQYFMRNSLGALLPIIYRINFFFPIG